MDNLALELLKGKFPRVNVEPYYRAAETYIDENTRRNKEYRRNMRGSSPLETLFLSTMDTVASAYALVSGEVVEGKVDRLLKDFETISSDYLKSIGLLTY